MGKQHFPLLGVNTLFSGIGPQRHVFQGKPRQLAGPGFPRVQGGEPRQQGRYREPRVPSHAVAVAGGSRGGIAHPTGAYDHPVGGQLRAVKQPYPPAPAVLFQKGGRPGVQAYIHPRGAQCLFQGPAHVAGVVGNGKYPLPPFHLQGNA